MEKEFRTLQLFYASALAESVYHYNNAGILGTVTEQKLKKQKLTSPAQVAQLGIKNPEELFEEFSKIFGCINWSTEKKGNELIATGNQCLLCSIAKKMQTAQPCFLYCVNPVKSMLEVVMQGFKLKVEETLWNGDKCIFKVLPQSHD